MSLTHPPPGDGNGDIVLAGLKARPFEWPTASPDPGCGRRQEAPIREPDPQKSSLHGFRRLPVQPVHPHPRFTTQTRHSPDYKKALTSQGSTWQTSTMGGRRSLPLASDAPTATNAVRSEVSDNLSVGSRWSPPDSFRNARCCLSHRYT